MVNSILSVTIVIAPKTNSGKFLTTLSLIVRNFFDFVRLTEVLAIQVVVVSV